MAEPWLDNLSEDWDPEPRSASSKSSSSTAQCRLPPQSPTSPPISQDGTSQAGRSGWKENRRILLGCSDSDINISHSPKHPSSHKPRHNGQKGQISSWSSNGSVFQNNSVVRKSRSSSPPKRKSSTRTADWKRLVMKGADGTCARQDLFSPIRLEGIFREPRPSIAGKTLHQPLKFSLFGGMIDIPSSPPIWPIKSHDPAFGELSENLEASRDQIEVMTEPELTGDTSKVGSSRNITLLENEIDTFGRNCSTSCDSISAPPTEIYSSKDVITNEIGAVVEHKTPSTTSALGSPGSNISSLDGVKMSSIQGGRHQLRSQPASSFTGDFSPVFVTKQKNADGAIDYNALDLSHPEVHKRLSGAIAKQLDGGFGRPQGPSSSTIQAQANVDQIFSDYPNNNSYNDHTCGFDQPDLSLAVDSPFSSSIMPSDSISQIHAQPNSNMVARHLSAIPDLHDGRPRSPLPVPSNQSRIIDPSKSPKSPLKLFGGHDTFTTGRLLSRMTQLHNIDSIQESQVEEVHKHETEDALEDTPEPLLATSRTAIALRENIYVANDTEQFVHDTNNAEHVSCAEPTAAHDSPKMEPVLQQDAVLMPELTQGKRLGPAVAKEPQRKRQRTVGNQEMLAFAEYVSHQVQEQHSQMHEFARGHQTSATNDPHFSLHQAPQASAQGMERPRNPTPGQTFHNYDTLSSPDSTCLDVVQDHIKNANVPGKPLDAAKIKLIASEMATFQIRGPQLGDGSVRKQSVSTQDYVDEATRIMDLIRSRRPIPQELQDVEEAVSDAITPSRDEGADCSSGAVSRPPSREGGGKAWRNNNEVPADPDMVNYLQRFQETGDESFMASSVPQSPEQDQQDSYVSAFEGESMNIRIADPLRTSLSTIAERELGDNYGKSIDSPTKTHSSNPSTDSTGRTILSKSSGRTRAVPVIAPGKVTHLISSIETAAGMRYDPSKQAWSKKKIEKQKASQDCSSSAVTEDDPFSGISDLSVRDSSNPDEAQDARVGPMQVTNVMNVGWRRDGGNDLQVNSATTSKPSGQAEQQDNYNMTQNVPLERLDHKAGLQGGHWKDDPREQVAPCLDAQQMASHPGVEQAQEQDRQNELIDEVVDQTDLDLVYDESIIETPQSQKISPTPAGHIRSKRRDFSVLFSSPPVSHEWLPNQWNHDSDNNLTGNTTVDLSSKNQTCDNTTRCLYPRTSARQGNQSLTLSRIDERHEMSLVETKANGRCLSLTLSISTPLPAHRSASVAIIENTESRFSSALHSLSPLSEFTVHQDDARHFGARQLRADQQLVLANRSINSAAVVDQLVKVLTDTEPEEPYWDSLRTLVLKDRALQSLHTLCTFCPSLEELDVSNNKLEQLSGIPPAVRHLNLHTNQISGLTSYLQMANLQYLDISSNNLQTLEGLNNLIHLRELRVDNNKITSLEGIFDLDALLNLSVRGNALECLDFHSADLRRLAKLDVAENRVIEVRGLDSLCALENLDLGHNRLSRFPCNSTTSDSSRSLRTLCISHNELNHLDISKLPSLENVNADENRLAEVIGIRAVGRLHTITLRDQKATSTKKLGTTLSHDLDNYPDLTHISLSGNSGPNLKLSIPLLNLRTLDLSFAGLTHLPPDLGLFTPNLRTLNLNLNALNDLKPLRGIARLKNLYVAGNRLTRLRRTVKTLAGFATLEEWDGRDNPFSQGFYAPTRSSVEVLGSDEIHHHDDVGDINVDHPIHLQHLLATSSLTYDTLYAARLDADTAARRRVYELLLLAKCKLLRSVDGLTFDRERVVSKDILWEKLVAEGVIEFVGCGKDTHGAVGLGEVREERKWNGTAMSCSRGGEETSRSDSA